MSTWQSYQSEPYFTYCGDDGRTERTSTIYPVKESKRDQDVRHEDFGLLDQHGRTIGVRITITRLEIIGYLEGEEYPESHQTESREPGIYWAASTHATRNGADFGAWTAPVWKRTKEAAEKAAQKKADGARKRYTKKFPPAERIAV